jgi:hypothetical protein
LRFLLFTGEYLVLDGAKATNKKVKISSLKMDINEIIWKSYDDDSIWFEDTLYLLLF